ncbi:T9SS type A sorting domain-containing protein [Flaviaesturariibacter amylovorans]|uniref:T9SS type A sorting domain-containing protein n=1 Tax=Flaviaesturariibacter amylovorans TaxID=1084520 RepID=A0ABP8H2U3_9BACT
MSLFYVLRKRNRSFAPGLLAGLFLLLFQSSAFAQHLAVNSGNWSDPATWSPASVPTSADAVTIASGVTVTVDVNSSAASVYINDGTSGAAATLTFTSGRTLTVGGTVGLGASNGAAGILSMASGGSLRTNGFYVHPSSIGSTFTPGSGSVVILDNNTLPAAFNTFNFLTLEGGVPGNSKTTTVTSDLTINGGLDVDDYSILDMGTGQLSDDGSANFNNDGAIHTQNISSSPLPIDRNWRGATQTGTVLYNADAAQTVVRGTYQNLYFDGNGVKTANGDIFNAGQIATLSAGTTFNMSTYKLDVPPGFGGVGPQTNVGTIRTQYVPTGDPLTDLAWPAGRNWGGTVMYDNPTGGQKVINGTYNNLTVSNTSGTTTSAPITVNGNFVTTAGTTLDMTGNQILGSFNASGHAGTLFTQAPIPFPAGKTFGGTVVYNNNQEQTVRNGNYNNLSITTIRNNTLTLEIGAISVTGDLVFTAVAPSFVTTNNEFKFVGSAAQNITATASVAGSGDPFVFYAILLDGAGLKTLLSPVYMDGPLQLITGVLATTSTNILTLNEGASVTVGGDTDSYIDGPMRRIGQTAFTFPLGGGDVYAPLRISAPGVGGDFTARYVRSSALGLDPTMQAPIVRISNCEYWNVVKNGGAADPTVQLTWSEDSPCEGGSYITNPATLVVARYNGTDWVSIGNGGTTGNATAGTIVSGPTTEYGNITLGSTNIENPLPVKFVSVRARKQNGGVSVTWKTATEYNVSHYEIERSADGSRFVTVAEVRATVNNGGGATYDGFDARAVSGNAYFRIKAVDIDGKLTFSSVVRLSDEKTGGTLTVFPNPVRNRNLTVQATDMASGVYEVSVVDVSGRVVLRASLEHSGGAVSQPLALPATTAPGLYSLRLSANGEQITKTFLVQ